MEQLALDLGGALTKEQVAAIAERERQLYGGGGDVAKRLSALKEQDGQLRSIRSCCRVTCSSSRRTLRRCCTCNWRHSKIIASDSSPTRPRALDRFLPLLEAKGHNHFDITFSRPPRGENGPVWIHPGEPVFDHLRELVNLAAAPHALRGAVVVDPSSSSSYLLHLASVAIVRRAGTLPWRHWRRMSC